MKPNGPERLSRFIMAYQKLRNPRYEKTWTETLLERKLQETTKPYIWNEKTWVYEKRKHVQKLKNPIVLNDIKILFVITTYPT